MLPKRLLFTLILVVVVLVAIGIWVGSWALSLYNPNPSGPSEYSAVYLTSGDIYFGKLSWFPWPHMKNVWLIQRTVAQNNQPQLGVAPFTSAFWGPTDEIYLNPKEIILWASLRKDSQLAKAFANPASVGQPPAQGFPPATSTFQGPSGPPPAR